MIDHTNSCQILQQGHCTCCTDKLPPNYCERCGLHTKHCNCTARP